jgi:dihydrofolate reductase
MKISIIVAASTNNVIGKDGGLPWRLPEDLKRFKEITMGKPMIMGRATWESIGRALPGRQNIVMTRQCDFVATGCEVVATIQEALAMAGDAAEVMIIGGGNLYQQFLPQTDRIYFTRVRSSIDGDTYFPELIECDWEVVADEHFPASPEREHAFDILTLDRVKKSLIE